MEDDDVVAGDDSGVGGAAVDGVLAGVAAFCGGFLLDCFLVLDFFPFREVALVVVRRLPA